MPGSNARAMEKARALAADAVILDLEDAVAPDAKATARDQVCEAVKSRGFGKREVVVRVNALDSQWGADDLAAAAQAKPDAILLPKVSSAVDLKMAEAKLASADPAIALWAMVETPLAILNAGAIAGAGGRLGCLVMGTNDLIKEFRGAHTQDRQNLSAALGISVAAARAYGLAIIDGVYNDIDNAEGFLDTCKQGRAFGFDGKTLIHPIQIELCNKIFSPGSTEIAWARKVIAAFDQPENKGKGAIALDGHMVERLHADIARRTVAMAEAIGQLQQP
jgi:citrate lyase subunit beta/citryl-CoA lyase